MKNTRKMIIGFLVVIIALLFAMYRIDYHYRNEISIGRTNIINSFYSGINNLENYADNANYNFSKKDETLESYKRKLSESATVYSYDAYNNIYDGLSNHYLWEDFPKSLEYVSYVTQYCKDEKISDFDEFMQKVRPFIDVGINYDNEKDFYKELETYLQDYDYK